MKRLQPFRRCENTFMFGRHKGTKGWKRLATDPDWLCLTWNRTQLFSSGRRWQDMRLKVIDLKKTCTYGLMLKL
ncbi:hypothetical protein CSA37_07230 [Candidatus Fermentibacteria bacterium]|nr:MAG: hypothetical protein CSA37_10125 [Candidatus Fermentibacteria bacterium]PIE52350.1 MAG: hypothetical protein CSA37_07230 [Candidatus Fermentibacteria bacterium]